MAAVARAWCSRSRQDGPLKLKTMVRWMSQVQDGRGDDGIAEHFAPVGQSPVLGRSSRVRSSKTWKNDEVAWVDSMGRRPTSSIYAEVRIDRRDRIRPLDHTGGQLLFRLVSAAYEKRSLAVASHSPFEDWGRFLPDQPTAVSLLDRLCLDIALWESQCSVVG